MPNTKRRPGRDRAWRRAQRARVIQARKGQQSLPNIMPCKCTGFFEDSASRKYQNDWLQKNWKLMYTRSYKLDRARKLGYLWPYPKKIMDELLGDMLEDIE